MFNIGGPEVLVIALIALVVVGPEQLPSVLRKAGQYAAQIRQMSTGLRQEFMAGVEELDPTKWEGERGTGELDKPIVPKGYSERVAAGEDGNPFKAKPVSQQMADASPDEAAAEAVAAAEEAQSAGVTAAEARATEARAVEQDLKAGSVAAGTSDAGDASTTSNTAAASDDGTSDSTAGTEASESAG